MSGERSRRHREAWPLVDRGRLVDEATELLEHRPVVVGGTAGIGKTGLATLVARRRRATGRVVVWIAASHAGRDVPLSAFSAFAGHDDGDSPTSIGAAVRTALGPLDAGPLLVVDDAQWLDPGSLALARQLIADGTAVLATVRTGEPGTDDWLALVDDGIATGVDLVGADRDLCGEIVRQVLGGPAAPELVDRLHARSAGNLLFLRELLLAALDGGAVALVGRRWELARDLPADDDLAGALTRRLRSLDEDARIALAALAMLEPISDDLFGHLPDAAHVPELERRGFVEASATGMLGVTHPLISAAARAALPVSLRRRELDRVTEVVLGKLDEHGSDLALRLVAARCDHELFVPSPWAGAAAGRAFALLDHELAARLGRIALAADPADTEANLAVGAALSALFRTEEAEPHLRAALAGARSDAQRARAAGRLGLHLGIRTAQPDEALDVMRTALERIDDPEWRAFLAADIGKIELMSGRGDAVGMAAGTEPVARLNQAIMGALVHATAGDVGGADRQVAIGLTLAPDHVATLPNAGDLLRLASFIARLVAGDVAAAEELAAEQLAACRTGRDEPEGMWLAMLATGALATGRPELALERATAAIPLVAARDFVGGLHPSTVAVRAVALAQLGRPGDAERDLADIDPAWHADPRTRASMLHATAWLAPDEDGERFADAARVAMDAGLVASALPIAYDSVRLGRPGPVVELLAVIAASAPDSIAPTFHAQATAHVGGDAAGLVEVSRDLADRGLLVFAADARAAAADLSDDPRRARWLLAEARELLRTAGAPTGAHPGLVTGTAAAEGALTERQLDVARLAAARWRSREIADHLGLSTRTVDNLLGRVYRTLGVSSRDELAALLGPAASGTVAGGE